MLSAKERDKLLNQARNGRRVFFSLVFGYPVLFVAMFATLAIIAPQGAGTNAFWTVIMILMLLGIAVVVLTAQDARSKSRGHLMDLRMGRVFIFSGSLPEGNPQDETHRVLLRNHLLSVGTEHIQYLETLAESRRILTANGRGVEKWITASWTETAKTPEFAAMAAEWLQPAAVSDETEVHSGQREWSKAEQNELARIVKDLRLPRGPAILLTLWFSLVACGYLISGRTPESGDLLRIHFLGLVALMNDVVYIARLNRARRMAADLRRGIMLILRFVTKAAPTDETDGDSVQNIEVLPHSRAAWTEQGKPASWRTSDSWLSVPRRVPK